MPLSVTMAAPAGTTPSVLHLPDGSIAQLNYSVTPPQVTVPASFVSTLLAAGWSIVVSSGTVHVP